MPDFLKQFCCDISGGIPSVICKRILGGISQAIHEENFQMNAWLFLNSIVEKICGVNPAWILGEILEDISWEFSKKNRSISEKKNFDGFSNGTSAEIIPMNLHNCHKN